MKTFTMQKELITRAVFAFLILSIVFQFYIIPISGSIVSLCLLLSFFSLITIRRLRTNIFYWYPFKLVTVLLLFYLVSFLWSPEVMMGVKSVIYSLQFLIIIVLGVQFSRTRPKFLLRLFRILGLCISLLAILVIVFRLAPSLEASFLRSGIAQVVINPNTLSGHLTGEAINNISDVSKSGAFFVNANVASGFLGISMLLFLGLFFQKKEKLFGIVSLLSFLGVLFSGSKFGLIMSITLIIWAFYQAKRKKILSLPLPKLKYVLISALIVIPVLVYWMRQTLINELIATGYYRMLAWNFGYKQFLIHPFLGHGFGGWDESIAYYAKKVGFRYTIPPHNNLIMIWSESGIAGLITASVFIIAILKSTYKKLHYEIFKGLTAISIGVTGALIWLFLQGAITNWGLFGEYHITPLIGLFIGYWFVTNRKANLKVFLDKK